MLFSRFVAVFALAAMAYAQTAPQGATSAPTGASAAAGNTASGSSTPAGGQGGSSQTNPGSHQKPTNSEAERERSVADPLLDLPPLPDNPATLVGGTVAKLDRIRDRMTIRPFGGGNMNVAFDMRTKIFRDGQPGTVHDLKPGSRVYVDTMLNGDEVFARSIRVQSQRSQGDARGQIMAYDARRQLLQLREQVSPQPVKLQITNQTAIRFNGKPGSVTDLEPGSLVIIRFEPGPENKATAQEINIVARPGTSFVFAGTVTFLDLRARRMAIDNRSDKENYEILIDSVPDAMLRPLKVGSQATVKAVFNGQSYQARTIEVVRPAASAESHD